jgi:hypothetical protein
VGPLLAQGGRHTGMVSRREFVVCHPSRIAKAFPRSLSDTAARLRHQMGNTS